MQNNSSPSSDAALPVGINVNKNSQSRFVSDGLRSFLEYRDLGVKAATDGRWRASLSRSTAAMPGGTGTHRHRLDVQLIYVLNGSATFEYAQYGEITVISGDCIYQPSTIVHQQTDRTRDCVVLEIVSPAQFPTMDSEIEAYIEPDDGPLQRFSVVRAADVGYTAHPFRDWMVRRDLGIDAATGGRVVAQLSRISPTTAMQVESSVNDAPLYLLFGLQGFCRLRFEGGQEITLLPSDCITIAAGCSYELLECDPAFECLEVWSAAT